MTDMEREISDNQKTMIANLKEIGISLAKLATEVAVLNGRLVSVEVWQKVHDEMKEKYWKKTIGIVGLFIAGVAAAAGIMRAFTLLGA